MLEKPLNTEAQKRFIGAVKKLRHPLPPIFETLIYLKHRKDDGLLTSFYNIETDIHVNSDTAQRYLNYMERIGLVKEVPGGKRKKVIVTLKGERFIFEGLRTVFHRQENIAKKIFFHRNLTPIDLLEQDLTSVLVKYSDHVIKIHTKFFKSWFVKQFGTYYNLEEWFNRFSKDYRRFVKQDLQEYSEKQTKKPINKSKRN